ncbi:MAG: hypothetical protein RLY31_2632 [Bacteroidota bacterium]|jgi:hypothetical protein
MGLFSFFKPPKPVGFEYHPRFYDPRKDEFRERLAKAREQADTAQPEAVKNRIRTGLRRKQASLPDRHYRRRQAYRSNLLLLVVIIVLVALTIAGIEIYLPSIIQMFE